MACHAMRAVIAAGALAVSLVMLSGTAMAETYRIDGQVWGWYQQYLRNIGNGNKPGAFAISKDGHSAAGGSILGLMMLGAAKGDKVELSAKGARAEERLAELVAMVEDGFGED